MAPQQWASGPQGLLQSSVNLRGSLPRVTWAQFISFLWGTPGLFQAHSGSCLWRHGLRGPRVSQPLPPSPAHPDLPRPLILTSPAGVCPATSICMSSLAHLLYFTVALLMLSSPAREASSWGLVNASSFLKAQLRSHRLFDAVQTGSITPQPGSVLLRLHTSLPEGLLIPGDSVCLLYYAVSFLRPDTTT